MNLKIVTDWVYKAGDEEFNENKHLYYQDFFSKYLKTTDIDSINEIIGVFIDIWNYFPHEELGNKSPSDLYLESMKNHSKDE